MPLEDDNEFSKLIKYGDSYVDRERKRKWEEEAKAKADAEAEKEAKKEKKWAEVEAEEADLSEEGEELYGSEEAEEQEEEQDEDANAEEVEADPEEDATSEKEAINEDPYKYDGPWRDGMRHFITRYDFQYVYNNLKLTYKRCPHTGYSDKLKSNCTSDDIDKHCGHDIFDRLVKDLYGSYEKEFNTWFEENRPKMLDELEE